MSLDQIVACRIHPAIGVARVGNSAGEFFIGPEAPASGPVPPPEGGYRDRSGAIKRQAARFRVFGLDARGRVVHEFTDRDAEIRWTVHVANKKAAWYEFNNALDIPRAIGRNKRRNAGVSDRASLKITPGPRTIAGPNQGGPAFELTGGSFLGVPVSLGEVRTDADGNLLFLGGHGRAASPGRLPLVHLANNDGWHDDISDGPVTARVRLKDGSNRGLDAEGAWVIVGPPNYGPDFTPPVTLYDTAFDTAVRAGWLRLPAWPSFLQQIYPIFARLAHLQWMSLAHFRAYGPGSAMDFLDPAVLRRLADPGPRARPFRQEVFRRFRDPRARTQVRDAHPDMWGDALDFADDTTIPDVYFSVTETQYGFLRQWAAGTFSADGPAPPLVTPATLDLRRYPLPDRPALLDRAALENCVGGAFHPGIEVTWPLRVPLLYASPFRIRHAAPGQVAAPGAAVPEDFGPSLSPGVALSRSGPLSASGPGDLTRWMSVPWQADDASCGTPLSRPSPAWWPARVPDHILRRGAYEQVMNTRLSPAQRRAAFEARSDWLLSLNARTYGERINALVREWPLMGMVLRAPGPPPNSVPGVPSELWVGDERG